MKQPTLTGVSKKHALPGRSYAYVFWGCLFCFSSFSFTGLAQQPVKFWNNLREKWISTGPDSVKVDSLSLMPGSVEVVGVLDSCYTIHELQGYLVWKHRPSEDSVLIRYRVFPEALGAPVFLRKPDVLNQGFVLNHPFFPQAESASLRADFPGQLQYNGSLGRSISFGNAQSVILRSALNLQVSGYLADSIQVQAAVSDQQLPVQPAGNTVALQDLDEVYVRFIRNPYQLQVGDFDLGGQTHFMRFFKRLQGVEISREQTDSGRDAVSFRLAGAVSRGVQARNVFQGQEGNQGPYPLHGNQGELHIVVLAGTEKVYLDGQLLQRGEDRDYVIDYNTGQLSFTPKHVITKDSRIQVEFEYANQYYANAQWYAEGQWYISPQWQMDMHVYSNADNRRAPLLLPLDASQQRFLREIGARVDQAFYPAAVPDTSLTQHVLYLRKDTLVNGVRYDSVYQYSAADRKDTLYQVTFSYVGPGKGDYVLSSSLANGRVYTWVAPINGLHQGDYVPAIYLVAPRSQQLVTLHTRNQLSPHSSIEGELAWSRLNINRFAPASVAVGQGAATYLSFQDQRSLGHFWGNTAKLRTQMNYEFVSHAFQALQPFREVEFNRKWSLPLDSVLAPADEHLFAVSTGVFQPEGLSLSYAWQGYWRLHEDLNPQVSFQGIAHELMLQYHRADLSISSGASFTHVQQAGFASTLWNPRLSFSRRWHPSGADQWELKASWYQEKNATHLMPADTLSPGSYDFQVAELGLLRSVPTGQIGFSSSYRLDRAPQGMNGFVVGSRSATLRLYGTLAQPVHQLQWDVAYRSLQVRDSQFVFHQDSSIAASDAKNQLTGQLVDHLSLGNGFMDHHLVYALAGSQQQRLSFTYVPVAAGQGQYEWVDYNHDGIPQVNEFQPAAFADQGNYVRIYTPTPAFIPTRQLQWDEQWTIDPSKLWQDADFWPWRLLSHARIEGHLGISLQRVSNKGPLVNPFQKPADSTLISRQRHMTHSLFLNPLNAGWGVDYTFQSSADQELMIYGQESHLMLQHLVHARWQFLPGYEISLIWKTGRMVDSIAGLPDQRYDYRFTTWHPSLQYIIGARLRMALEGEFAHKRNDPRWGGEQYNGQSFTGTFTWSQIAASRIEASLSFNQIQFSGNPQSPAGFSMLQGLLPGVNWLWHIGLIRRLAGNLELNLSYDGRKTGIARVIHTGSASLRAVF